MKRLGLTVLVASFLSLNAWAYDPKVEVTGHDLPPELVSVGVDEHLGAALDLDLYFQNEMGETVPLRSFMHKGRPVLMAMVYYNCPSLCNYHLNGLVDTMKQLKWSPGQEFEVVEVSMNHRETPDLAAKKKHNYMAAYGRVGTENGFHFLVGDQANVQTLAQQLGFRFQWLEDKQQYAHAAVAYVITPEGKISRYLHGIQPEVDTLKMSLLEASNGRIGSIIEQVLMFCFQFDPQKNKYTLYAWNIMRVGAILMVLLLAVLLLPALRKELWRGNLNNGTKT